MQAIDGSGLLGINKNLDFSGWAPIFKYVWDPAAKTVTITNETVAIPASATRRFANIQVHDKYGNTAHGSMQSGGTGYTSAPTVTFTGGGGTGAAATAQVTDGVVSGFTITAPGTGYATAPTVGFTGGGGSGAAATATTTNGGVSAISATVASSGAIDISGLSVNKGLNISLTAVISNGWSATGSAIAISNAPAGGYLQDYNIRFAPASANANLIQ